MNIRKLYAQRLAAGMTGRRTTRVPAKRPITVTQLEDRVNPAPVQFFYVPMPEGPVNDAFDTAVTNTNVSDIQDSSLYITVTESGTTVWYDQWEDGYEAILGTPKQSTTQVWGDGNDANGIAPGFASDPNGLAAGTVLKLRNNVTTPRNTTTQPLLYDSPDRFGSDKTVAVSRLQFPIGVGAGVPTTGGSVIASSVEVRDTRFFDTNFVAPVGIDTLNATASGGANSIFSLSALYAQAFVDNTHIQIDANNDGDFTDAGDVDGIFNQGETAVSGNNVVQGGRVVSDKPVQADLLTAQIGGQYTSRTYALFSNAQRANNYFTPVGFDSTAGATADDSATADDIRLYVYNPNATAINVRRENNAGIGAVVNIPAGTGVTFDVTTNTGTRIFSVDGTGNANPPGVDTFLTVGVHDATGTSNTGVTHDWGFSLQPVSALSQIAVVGLGVGNSANPPSSVTTNPSGATSTNSSPVWVTALGDTTLQVDYNGDGTVDAQIPVTRLQAIRLRDTVDNDNDNSGMKIFTLDGTLISVAWGEDGTAPDGSPGLDAGTTVPAVPVPEYYKFSTFAPGGDVNGDGFFNEGDTIRYTLRIRNIGATPITNVAITDTLPFQVTYITAANGGGTFYAIGSPSGTPVAIPDDGSGTAYPLDGSGFTFANVNSAQEIYVTFDVRINTGLPAGANFVLNQSVLTYDVFRIPANDVIDLRASLGDSVWVDQNGNGVQDFTDTNGNGRFDVGEPGEAGIPNVTVNITDGNSSYTRVTDANGRYLLSDIPAGTYTVTIDTSTLPANVVQTFDRDSTLGGGMLDNKTTVVVGVGQGISDVDFGYRSNAVGTIGDTVFYDANGNGTQDGNEPGIAGVTVTAVYGGKDGDLATTTDNITFVTVTDANGKYSFPNVPAGDYKGGNPANPNYRITVTQPTGYPTATADPDGVGTPNTTLLTLAPGDNNTAQDFGYGGTGAIGDLVFEDFNGDGIQNGADTGINGVTVELYYDSNNDGDFLDAGENVPLVTTTTKTVGGISGVYDFPNLAPGNYQVVFGNTAGAVTYTRTAQNRGSDAVDSDADVATGRTATITVTNSTADATVDAGLYRLVTLGDRVWFDLNGNGVDDAEAGIPNVLVTVTWAGPDGDLTTIADNQTFTDTTDATGNWSIANLPPGNYSVALSNLPQGVAQSYELAEGKGTPTGTFTSPGVTTVTATSGTDRLDVDFGFRGAGTIGDRVFLDVNNNGKYDAGEGLDGVTVTLVGDIDGDGKNDTLTTTTSKDGFYQFDNVRFTTAGSPAGVPYTISVNTATLPDGLTNTTDPDGGTANQSIVRLTTATNDTQDFGYRGTGQIGDRIFNDVNGNGVYDAGEGVAGVTVTLTGDLDNDGVSETVSTVTDTDGFYQFTGLVVDGTNGAGTSAKTYTVDVDETTLPASYATTPTIDPQGALDGTATATLSTASPTDLTRDFAYGGPGSIGDTIFLDLNNNGVADAGEGLAGVTVTLTGDIDGDGTNETIATTTDANGNYTFGGLRVAGGAGVTYTVAVDTATLPKTGAGTPITNTADPDNGTANQAVISLTTGTPTTVTQDFGYQGPGSIGDRVFLDLNGDGVWNPGEGLTGVTLTLTGDVDGDGVTDTFTATTDADGKYTFANLPVNTPAGKAITYTVSVGAGVPTGVALSADPDSATPLSSTFVLDLTTDPTRDDIDFGYKGTGTLGDRVWIDADGDGLQGPAALEPGLPLAGLTLTWAGQDGVFGTADDVTTTTVAGQDGSYGFANLPPGAFRVVVDTASLPGNVSPTADTDDAAPAVDGVANVTLTAGQNRTDVDFGYRGTASVGDRVFLDTNGNGTQDGGEPGVPGATVSLTWAGPNGTLGDADDVTFTTTTDKTGFYTFPGLPVNGPDDQFRVTVTPPAGLTPTADPDGTGTPSTAVVTVAAGQTFDTADFGYRGTGSLSGSVYHDLDNDGVRDAGEPGLGGVTVTLTGTDSLGNPVTLTATTAGDGTYTFTALLPGTYTVTETQPAAYRDGTDTAGTLGGTVGADTFTTVQVGAGDAGTGYNFGERGTTISGTVFRDDDRDGTQSAGEPGVGGVTVTLLDGADNPVLNPATGQPYVVTTAADGTYTFAELPTGSYRVVETQPAGYANGPVGPATTRDVTLPLAGVTGQNFAEVLGAVRGTVYQDRDADGVRDGGEPGLGGVTVTLTGTDVFGNPVNRTTTTAADGTYSFDNVFPANGAGYTVTEGAAAGYADGPANAAGTAGGAANGANQFTGVSPAAGQLATGYNFGELGAPIVGTVFRDDDRDGTRDPGEPPIPGVTLELVDATGTVVATTVTGTDGGYSFTNVPPGNYTVRETQPAGYGSTTPDAVPVTVGTTPVAGVNFGESLGSVAGSVYLDVNEDGVRQPGEPGLGGVQVVLTGTDAAGNPVSRTTTTAADGTYTFVNLPAGTYTVTELQPTGFFDGPDTAGTVPGGQPGTAGNDVVSGIVLPAGGAGTGYVFAERQPTAPTLGTTSVSGSVYEDTNRNGVRDGGEPGLPGVVIQLVDANGNVAQTTTTGPNGTYLFITVPPGNYTVVQPAQPGGYGSTTPNAVPVSVPATLAPVVGVNFGEARATVSGSVYVDQNGNGTRDPGEPGLGGVTVTLTGTDAAGNPVARTTTTDANGNYAFTGLPPSDLAGYTLTETQPAAFGDGPDAAGSLGGTAGNDVITRVVVPTGGTGSGYNFAELAPPVTPPATFITGTVFTDRDRDGTLGAGEPGVGGVTVQLLDATGAVIATTTTSPDGSYLFPGVPPGQYTVREVQPGTLGSSSPNAIPVVIPSSPNPGPVFGVNFGETLGSIGGSVFNDLNASGVRNPGEPGIPGVTVTLTGTDTAGNPVARTTTTDANGNYLFADLPAGTYTVREASQPAGYADGAEAVGTAGGGTGTNDAFTAVAVGGGVQAAGYTFAEIGLNSISGSYYLDFDLNAVLTTGPGSPDRPIANAPVLLVGTDVAGNPITRSTFTGADGVYVFANLPAGTYRVIQDQDALPTTAIPADGVYDGAETVGSLGGSNPANNVLEVTLTGGSPGQPAQSGTGYNFGEIPPADPFGYVYQDTNGNGVRDPGEPGIAGVTVTLSGTAFAGTPFARPLTDADVPGGLTRVTDANGLYQFNPIPPGLYTLTQTTQPAGLLDGAEEIADPNPPFTVVAGNNQFSNIMLAPLPIRGPFNFAGLQPSSLSGTVYLDANRNGVRDAGEPGLTGVTVVLTGTDDRGNPVSATVQTDADGNYSFTNLRPGTYNIAEQQPAGLTQGVNQIGTAGGAVVATDTVGQIIIGPGVNGTGYVFAETTPLPPPVVPGVPPVVRPQPVPALPPLSPIVSVAPGAEMSKRTFLASTPELPAGRVPTERTTPDFAALGSVNDTRPVQFIATAEGPGGELVRVFDLTGGQERFRFRPFPGNPGGVRVATADVTGDGIPDVIAVSGAGGGPRVIIYDGQNGAVVQDFMAFEESFTGGLNVSAGDLDGDGRADVVISPDVGGGPRVKVLSGGDPNRVIADFMGIDDPNFRGGVRTAVGDVNGDGTPDLVVGAGAGGGPRVATWDGRTVLGGSPTRLTADFFAFENTLRNGVHLTVADVDGDGRADILTGAGPGGSPRVLGFSANTLLAGQPTIVADFTTGTADDRGGVPVAAVDLDGDGRAEVFTGAGEGSAPLARFTDPRTGRVIDEFAAEYFEFLGGIGVG